jgi:biopolymer transport protein ExbD
MTTGSKHSIINVTPLIDILLVLMMIMMVITPITSQGLPAAVPLPALDHPIQSAEQPLVVRIDRDSHLWLNSERVQEPEFDQKMTRLLARRADSTVFVDGDKDLTFASVAMLVDRVRGLGFTRAAILPASHK